MVTTESSQKLTLSKSERIIATLCHLTFFLGITITPTIVVFFIWLFKRKSSAFVDHHGREAINFQLTLLLILILVFAFFLIGSAIAPTETISAIFVILMLVITLTAIALVIMAAVRANEGVFYRYPLTIPFLRQHQ